MSDQLSVMLEKFTFSSCLSVQIFFHAKDERRNYELLSSMQITLEKWLLYNNYIWFLHRPRLVSTLNRLITLLQTLSGTKVNGVLSEQVTP